MTKDVDLNTHLHFIFWGLCDTIFISWKISQEGWTKLNYDGTYKESLNLVG